MIVFRKTFCISKFILLPIYFLLLIVQAKGQSNIVQANIMYQEGLQLSEKSEFQVASTKFEEAAKMYRNDQIWDKNADCQYQNIKCLLRLGNTKQAIELADFVQQNEVKQLQENCLQIANLKNIAGEIYMNSGRNDIAMENLQDALRIYEQFHQQNKRETAVCYNNLALVYWNKGNRDLAIDYQQKALALRMEVYPENHPEIAAAYNDLGLIYSLSDLENARINYEKALRLYQAFYTENHPKTATAYNNLAIIYLQEEDYEQSLVNFEKTLRIWEKIYDSNHPNIAFVLSNIGQVYLAEEDFEKALEYQKKALAIYQKNYGNKHPEIANIYNLMGTILIRQNKYKLALNNYQNALLANVPDFQDSDIARNPNGNEFYNADVLLNSLLLKAQALEAQHLNKTLKVNDLKLALETLELCDKLIGDIRQLREKKSDKIALGLIASEVYEDAIRSALILAEGALNKSIYYEKAFDFSEKSKSAVLLESIASADAKSFTKLDPALVAQEKKLNSEIALLEQQLAQKPDADTEKTLRNSLFSLNQNYKDFIKKLETQYPEYFNLKFNIKTATVQEIQAQLDDKTAMLSYFVADKTKRIYIFCITKKKFWIEDVAQQEKFKKYLVGLRNGIQFDSKKVFLESATQLYAQLFPKKISKKIDKLIIIPEGRLGAIPFEVLVSKNPEKVGKDYRFLKYLVMDYDVSYHYSATLFKQNKLKSLEKTANQSAEMLIVAPITFDNPLLSNLPATESEAILIQNLMLANNKKVKVLLRKNAFEANLKSDDLKNYRVLHLATHGIVDEDNPELSQLFLMKDAVNDGNLFLGEIFNLEMKTDLVTLSACETGLGKVSKGEGIIGLTRALLFAGAKNLIVSLWSVSDSSTAQLMIDFYKNLLNFNDNSNFGKSLRNAKLAMIQSEEFARPYFWAPFVLIGE